jgi:hypothetical protein
LKKQEEEAAKKKQEDDARKREAEEAAKKKQEDDARKREAEEAAKKHEQEVRPHESAWPPCASSRARQCAVVDRGVGIAGRRMEAPLARQSRTYVRVCVACLLPFVEPRPSSLSSELYGSYCMLHMHPCSPIVSLHHMR